MGYVSYAEGFNSGGVSISNIGDVRLVLPYDPKTLKNREIGLRSDLLDGRPRFNATYFDTIWDDIQASGVVRDPNTGIDLPGLATRNVGEAEASGIEIEMTYLPTDDFMVDFTLGLLDTEYTDIALGTAGGGCPAAAPPSRSVHGEPLLPRLTARATECIGQARARGTLS